MIFSEIYGSYFKAVSVILTKAVEGNLTERELTRIVTEHAFGESTITIPARLKDGSWPLLTDDLRTPLRHAPHLPLTTLEKQWLKALLLDPRIRLFEPSEAGLEDVEPLFTPDQFVFFDRYLDGDDYTDPVYIEHFRTVLKALREKKRLRIRFHSSRDARHSFVCTQYRLEYSSKDDKFRLAAEEYGRPLTVNLSRINSVQILEPDGEYIMRPPREKKMRIVMELTDERNGLERVMLHFSDLEKETEKIGRNRYRISLQCRREDETEILIRILSFGPILRVTEPKTIVTQIRERISHQAEWDSWAEKQ